MFSVSYFSQLTNNNKFYILKDLTVWVTCTEMKIFKFTGDKLGLDY